MNGLSIDYDCNGLWGLYDTEQCLGLSGTVSEHLAYCSANGWIVMLSPCAEIVAELEKPLSMKGQ